MSSPIQLLVVVAIFSSPQLIGVVNSPDGKVVCFELASGDQVQSISLILFDMVKGEKTTQEAAGFQNGNYFFVNIPKNETEKNYAYQIVLGLSDGTEFYSHKYEETTGRWFDWLGSDVKWTEAVSGVAGRSPLIDAWYSPFPGFESYIGFNMGNVFKALVTCPEGYFQYIFPEDTPYDLLKMQYGVANMDPETGSTDGNVNFAFWVNDQLLFEQVMYAAMSRGTSGPYARDFETAIMGGTKVKMAGHS